ncbi:MAG TPA: hypothetical protein VNI77_12370, partial [Nitrososphaera sp.]|nr:hypothetical protein [Nitrososphaera sp.]
MIRPSACSQIWERHSSSFGTSTARRLGEPEGFQDPNTNIENGAIVIYEQFDKILLGDAYTSTNATQMAMRLYNQTSKATEGGISLLNGGSRL